MARPWKDPKTGTYHLRQRPPRDLIARVKGTRVMLPIGARPVLVTVGAVVQASLRTETMANAKTPHSEADAALKRDWDAVRAGQRALIHKAAVALAGAFYRAATQCIDDDRSRYRPRVIAEAKRLGSEPATHTDSRRSSRRSPLAQSDGRDAPGLGDDRVPGLATMVADVGIGSEDAVAEPVVPHELPEVSDGVEFG
jgi:hypothetical protein